MWKIALLLLPLLGGCGQEDLQAPPPADWGRSPYFGSVKVAVYAPDGREMTELGDFGTASARFQNLDDARARLLLSGNIREDGDTGFVLDGRSENGGWTSRSEHVDVRIDRDGKISGEAESVPDRFTFDGTIEAKRLALEVDMELLEARSGLPRGSRFRFTYSLWGGDGIRDNATAAVGEGNGRDEGDGSCRRVEWRLRNVPNLSGGPMGMVRVPVCMD